MAKTKLSNAKLVQYGYGQVEPNHLSAQRTGQIYAQLPAADSISVLENGQFVKYNYAQDQVDFAGAGEWMLVFNEVKLYRDNLGYSDFAMKKEDYVARVYSPIDGEQVTYANARKYEGVVSADPYEPDSTTNPFVIEQFAGPKAMGANAMVPRVFKTNVGDIFTTNTINNEKNALASGDILHVDSTNGYLTTTGEPDEGDTMRWQVVKVYTLADRQPAVKVMRIA
jgi:hypothetical protein